MLIIFSHKASAQSFSQFYLSEVWDKEGGQMPMFYRNASTTDNLNNVYVVGSTVTITNGYDILVQKFNPKGLLIWEQSFDGGALLDDLGVAIFVDDNYNVFVTGAATQSIAGDLDLVVLKFKEDGD